MEEKEFVIRGVAHDDKVAKLAVLGVPNHPGIAHSIFSALAKAHVDVDMIVQSIRNIEKNVTMANSGQYDEAGNRMVTNTESNGRFHTDWLNMIYPRLRFGKGFVGE